MNTSAPWHIVRRSTTVAYLVIAVSITVSVSGQPYSALIAFGDSLSDVGNLYTTLREGGDDDETIYIDIGYTAAPGRYDNGRYSNGPLWVEHLANQLGLGPLAPNNGEQPLTMGTDFAYAGARSGTGGTDFIIPNLLTQIECYLTLPNTASPTALYTIWAGGNDVIDYIGDGMPNTPAAIEPFTDMMAANISTAVTTLYDAGARNFLVANLPALGDKPDYVNTPNQSFANDMVTSFNPQLAEDLANLRPQYPGLRVAAWDMYSDFNQVLNDPASFGFTNDTDASFSSSGPYPGTVVANPNQHVFWDDTHPTAPGHQILGQFAYQAVLTIPQPASLVLMSVSIAIACGCLRAGCRRVGRY
jgi:cholinesterase